MAQQKALAPLSNLISLAGKTALITGAAAGMGAATARRFAEAGAALLLVDIDEGRLAKLGRQLEDAGGKVSLYPADLADRMAIARLWQEMAVQRPTFWSTRRHLRLQNTETTALVEKVAPFGLYAAYWLCQLFVRCRLERGGRRTVNISSVEAMLFKEDMAHLR